MVTLMCKTILCQNKIFALIDKIPCPIILLRIYFKITKKLFHNIKRKILDKG